MRKLIFLFFLVAMTAVAFSIVYAPHYHSAQLKKRKSQLTLKEFSQAIDKFWKDCGRYPTTIEGLQYLVEATGVSNWNGPYLDPWLEKGEFIDPWGHPFKYYNHAGWIRLLSLGSDGVEATADDVCLEVHTEPIRAPNRARDPNSQVEP